MPLPALENGSQLNNSTYNVYIDLFSFKRAIQWCVAGSIILNIHLHGWWNVVMCKVFLNGGVKKFSVLSKYFTGRRTTLFPSTVNWESGTLNSESWIRNSELWTLNREFGTLNSESWIRNTSLNCHLRGTWISWSSCNRLSYWQQRSKLFCLREHT